MSILSDASLVRTAANITTVLFALVIFLQILLAAGILPVSMAWGGQYTDLTTTLRFASLAAAFILLLFIYVIRRRAGLMDGASITTAIKIAAWVITGFMALNTLGNITSQSMGEKILFTPITFVLAVLCFFISLSKT